MGTWVQEVGRARAVRVHHSSAAEALVAAHAEHAAAKDAHTQALADLRTEANGQQASHEAALEAHSQSHAEQLAAVETERYELMQRLGRDATTQHNTMELALAAKEEAHARSTAELLAQHTAERAQHTQHTALAEQTLEQTRAMVADLHKQKVKHKEHKAQLEAEIDELKQARVEEQARLAKAEAEREKLAFAMKSREPHVEKARLATELAEERQRQAETATMTERQSLEALRKHRRNEFLLASVLVLLLSCLLAGWKCMQLLAYTSWEDGRVYLT